MTLSLILLLASTMAAVAHGAHQEAPAPVKRGVYLERTGDAPLEPLRASLVTDSRTSGTAKAMFGMRPTVTLIVSGAGAALKLEAAEPSFRIALFGGAKRRGQMPDVSEMADMMDAPSVAAKEGKEFMLVRLVVKGDERELDVKKGKVPSTVEKIADHIYRLRPGKPLEAGEYAICHVLNGMPVGQLWDFAVTQP
jgi:hypothetical protein